MFTACINYNGFRYFKVKLHLFLQIVLVLIVNEDLKNVTSFKRCRRKVKPKCT